jgi:O-antigen ligase
MYSTVIDDRLPLPAATAGGPLPSGAGSHPANFQARPDAPRLRNLDLLRPNFWVRTAFYCTLLAIPFLRLYVPGTGERVGVQRVVQLLMLAAMFSRPRVCLRFVPYSLLWFFPYCAWRIVSGLWQAPEYSQLWWPNSLELLQFYLPLTWLIFNVLHYPKFGHGGLWAYVIGVSLCALLHAAGIGVVEVDQGIDGRSAIFGQNANEIGEIYGVALVALVALGLFRDTKQKFRFIVFPLAALVAIGLAKTGSRTGTLFALLGILILLPQTRAFVPRVKRYVVILLLAAVFAGVVSQIPTVLNRFQVASSGPATDESRVRMIPVLWDIFLRSPLLGTGPDRYQYELTRRAMPYLAEKQQTINSHNLALLLLVETGLIGFALFSIGLGKALVSAWRGRNGPRGLLPLAWLLPMSIGGLTFCCPIFAPVFWLAIAYSLAPTDQLHSSHSKVSSSRFSSF